MHAAANAAAAAANNNQYTLFCVHIHNKPVIYSCLNDVYCYQKYGVLCLYIKGTVIWGGRFLRQWCRLICAQVFEALIFAIYRDRKYGMYATMYVCTSCCTTTTLTPLTQKIFFKTLHKPKWIMCDVLQL